RAPASPCPRGAWLASCLWSLHYTRKPGAGLRRRGPETTEPPRMRGLDRDSERCGSGDRWLGAGVLVDHERRALLDRVDAHPLTRLVLVLELHDPVDERVDRVVAAEADVLAGVEHRADLTDDDVPGDDLLAAELLDAAKLRIRVAPVLRGADSFLVCHGRRSSSA